MLVAEQIIGVNFRAENQLNAFQIAGTEVEGVRQLLTSLNQQGRLLGVQLVESGAIQLGLFTSFLT